MADHTTAEGGHPDMDYAEHDWTYDLFIKLIKWVLAAVILIMIFLAYMWG